MFILADERLQGHDPIHLDCYHFWRRPSRRPLTSIGCHNFNIMLVQRTCGGAATMNQPIVGSIRLHFGVIQRSFGFRSMKSVREEVVVMECDAVC